MENITKIDQKNVNKSCANCGRKNHFGSVCRTKKSAAITVNDSVGEDTVSSEEQTISGFLASLSAIEPITSPQKMAPAVKSLQTSTSATVNSVPVPHHTYDYQLDMWIKNPPKASPTVEVTLTLDRAAYKELRLAQPDLVKKNGAGYSRARTATVYTCKQLTFMNEEELSRLGIKKSSIFPLTLAVNTVKKSSIDLISGVFLKFSSYNNLLRKTVSTRQLCYVSRSVQGIYLSE